MRAALTRLLGNLPTRLWRRLRPKSVLGLCYHMVSDRPLPHLKHYQALVPAAFEADLDYLQHAFGFTRYAELADRRRSLDPRRDNAVILTFDDGFAECANIVAPILLRRGVDCVFFVITDLIDNGMSFRESAAALCIEAVLRKPVDQVEAVIQSLHLGPFPPPPSAASADMRSPLELAGLGAAPVQLRPLLHWLLTLPADAAEPLAALCEQLGVDPAAYVRRVQPYLTRAQILRLHQDGFTIGAHSRSHRLLQSLTRTEAEDEIAGSCHVIQEITGQASVPFAFPYFGGDLDRTWLQDLRQRHDVIGLYFDTDGLREDVPFVVQRVFGERFSRDRTLEAIFRRAWSRRAAWRRSA